MATLIEQESEKKIKQGQNNHVDEEIEIDLMDILRRIVGIRKAIYKAAGIGLLIGIVVAISNRTFQYGNWWSKIVIYQRRG